jgi:hypothetical protein
MAPLASRSSKSARRPALVLWVVLCLGLVWVAKFVWEVNQPPYSALLSRLSTQDPGKHFAVYRYEVPINAHLTNLRVDHLKLSKGEPYVTTTVSFASTASKTIAPVVNVSLYDGEGKLIVRSPMVDPNVAELSPNHAVVIERKLMIGTRQPVIVAVDDDPS